MGIKPFAGYPCHFIKRTGLLEEVCRAWNNDELLFAAKLCQCGLVQLHDITSFSPTISSLGDWKLPLLAFGDCINQ
jgi:hypothetical protein